MFEIRYPLDAQKHAAVRKRWVELVNKAQTLGITLRHDGSFTGHAEGMVEITPSVLVIEVHDKPWGIPEFMVRDGLRDMLDAFFA